MPEPCALIGAAGGGMGGIGAGRDLNRFHLMVPHILKDRLIHLLPDSFDAAAGIHGIYMSQIGSQARLPISCSPDKSSGRYVRIMMRFSVCLKILRQAEFASRRGGWRYFGVIEGGVGVGRCPPPPRGRAAGSTHPAIRQLIKGLSGSSGSSLLPTSPTRSCPSLPMIYFSQ